LYKEYTEPWTKRAAQKKKKKKKKESKASSGSKKVGSLQERVASGHGIRAEMKTCLR